MFPVGGTHAWAVLSSCWLVASLGCSSAVTGSPSSADAGAPSLPDVGRLEDYTCDQPEPWTEREAAATVAVVDADRDGGVWRLDDWPRCSRPYPKPFAEREAWYRARWGEHWHGPAYLPGGSSGLMSPGTWRWEEYAIIPDGKRHNGYDPETGAKDGKSQGLVFAPGGEEEVTDLYVLAANGIWHVDPRDRSTRVIGRLEEGGLVDGLDDQACLTPNRSRFESWATVDPVTGRLFFEQGKPASLRFVEKLLPYRAGGRELLLPALLDYRDLYREVRGPEGAALSKVMVDGVRAPPRFAVRTGTVVDSVPRWRSTWGSRVLLSPDGRRILAETDATWPANFHAVHAFDTWDWRDLGPIRTPAVMPRGTSADPHQALSSLYDGFIYLSLHTGSGGGPGRLFRFSPETGAVDMLYDSVPPWAPSAWTEPKSAKNAQGESWAAARKGFTKDGPADAATLLFETLCFQSQSPRSGAILNGGWDASGIRHYHDGFVTSLVAHAQMGMSGGRPEWGADKVAAFGSLQSAPDVAPNGDVFLTSCQEETVFVGDPLRQSGIRVIRLHRTDWPAAQPVNHYANQFLAPEQRLALMKAYAQHFIDTLSH